MHIRREDKIEPKITLSRKADYGTASNGIRYTTGERVMHWWSHRGMRRAMGTVVGFEIATVPSTKARELYCIVNWDNGGHTKTLPNNLRRVR